jgi:hypothetical protein
MSDNTPTFGITHSFPSTSDTRDELYDKIEDVLTELIDSNAAGDATDPQDPGVVSSVRTKIPLLVEVEEGGHPAFAAYRDLPYLLSAAADVAERRGYVVLYCAPFCVDILDILEGGVDVYFDGTSRRLLGWDVVLVDWARVADLANTIDIDGDPLYAYWWCRGIAEVVERLQASRNDVSG